jgi:hypothetical protein
MEIKQWITDKFGAINEGQIYIFYGKMGSGKTTNATREILRFWRRGDPVWVNFPIDKLPERKDTFDSPIYFEPDPAGILSMRDGLYVIDEAYLKLNSRNWKNLSEEIFTAFTHIRKLGMTCIIIAQSYKRIDVSIREVSSIARQFKGASYLGRVYPYIEYEIDEMGDIIKGEPVEFRAAHQGFSFVRKETYAAFDTDHLFDDNPPKKTWVSAIGYKSGAASSPPVRPPQTHQITTMRDDSRRAGSPPTRVVVSITHSKISSEPPRVSRAGDTPAAPLTRPYPF